MAQVDIKTLRKSYGALEVIKGVDLGITDGEFVTLVGPSGCGKSTLLRMIAGLEEITSGTVTIGDTVVNDLPPKARDIAMVFQNYALYPHLTVAENMAFSLKIRKASKAEIAERVSFAAGVLGLESLLERYPKELSGGQRQRVAMGRAIIRDPKAFLFDEPLSNLDAKLRVRMRSEIKALHQKLKTTIVYVTHDQVEAMTMADRVVVMRDGWIEQVGSPIDLYDNPANRFVAGFIGSPAMNFLDGRLVDGDFVLGDLRIPVGVASADRAVTLGIRPEHVSLNEDGVKAEVAVVEPMGSETQLVLSLAGNEFILRTNQRVTPRPGSLVGLKPSGPLHFFDPETEAALSFATN